MSEPDENRKSDPSKFLSRHYPEVNVGGYSAVDGTVEFYSRINSLLDKSMIVLDLGAGRAAWFEDGTSAFKTSLRLLKGKVNKVIACDVDPIVLENRTVDEAFVIQPGEPLKLPDASIDMVIADYVFEHVPEPEWLGSELQRILKPGGWVAARTPCKFNYVALAARSIPNRLHAKWLKSVQPTRKEVDVFPTRYKLNTIKALNETFPKTTFDNWTYYFGGEPAYHFNKSALFYLLRFIAWLAPKQFHANLFIFLHKKTE